MHIKRDLYSPQDIFLRGAYAPEESMMQVEAYGDTGYDYQYPLDTHYTPLISSTGHLERARTRQDRPGGSSTQEGRRRTRIPGRAEIHKRI